MNAKIILLDVAQGMLEDVPVLLVLHVVSTILIEGTILYFFKYRFFLRSLLDAFIANSATFVVGLIFYEPMQYFAHGISPGTGFSRKFFFLIVLCLITIIIEALVLKLLNKSFSTKRIILISVLMNILTYITFYLLW